MGRTRGCVWLCGWSLTLSACYGGLAGSTDDLPVSSDTDPGQETVGSTGDESSGGDETEGSTGDDPESDACVETAAAAGSMNRLTRIQYDNTVRDLTGVDLELAQSSFPEDQRVAGFEVGGSVAPLTVELHLSAAETIAAAAIEDLSALLPCDPADDERACGEAFVDDFGSRAYRRPLRGPERQGLLAVFDAGHEASFATGIELVITTALMSPRFHYHAVATVDDAAAGETIAADGYAVASRLSYFLWNTMPDRELFTAAEAGELSSPAQVETMARRMVDDPRTRDGVLDYYRQWLRLDQLETLVKNPEVYPDFDPETSAALRHSLEAWIEDIYWGDAPSDTTELLLSRNIYADGSLAQRYDVEGIGANATSFEPGQADASKRAGLLTHPGLMTALSKPNQSDPVHRGLFVREQLLCDVLPPPPPDVVFDVPEPMPGATTRERFEAHTMNPSCAGCHILIDPLGFGFEHYDGVGAWRDEDQSLPVDATGQVAGGPETAEFDGAVELAEHLASNPRVDQCIANQWLSFAVRRGLDEVLDDCSRERIGVAFAESGGDLRELLVQIAVSDAFRLQQVSNEE